MAPEEKPYRVYRGGRRGPKLPKLGAAVAQAGGLAPGETEEAASTSLAPAHRAQVGRHRLLRLPALARRMGPCRLLLVPRRRQGGKQARAGGCEAAALRPGQLPHDEPDDDPPARDRYAPRARPAGAPALRLDHARSYRPGPPPSLLPLDPARPLGRHPGLRVGPDQHRVPDRRLRPRAEDDQGVHRPRHRPRRHRRLPALQAADRPDRRRRRLRAACDPLEPLRLPAQAGEVRNLDRLALREGHAAHGRPPCARLLARP